MPASCIWAAAARAGSTRSLRALWVRADKARILSTRGTALPVSLMGFLFSEIAPVDQVIHHHPGPPNLLGDGLDFSDGVANKGFDPVVLGRLPLGRTLHKHAGQFLRERLD